MHELSSPSLNGMTYLLEGAHNPSGMLAACAQLKKQERWRKPWTLLFGSTPQLDMNAMLEPLTELCDAFPPAAIVLTEPQFGRYPGVPCAELKLAFNTLGLENAVLFAQPKDAVQWIESGAVHSTTVLCIGSLYLLGNVLNILGADSDDDLAVVVENTDAS